MRTGWIYSGLCSPEYIHIPFYPPLLSQRPRRGIAALRAGACTASTIHCLIPRENCISNFHCPQRGRTSLTLVLSLRGARCNYPLTCFAGHYHFIKRLCRRHCVPLTLSKAGCAPAVPTETIHQQPYSILPPSCCRSDPGGVLRNSVPVLAQQAPYIVLSPVKIALAIFTAPRGGGLP